MGILGLFGGKKPQATGKTILVVEDEPDIAEGLQALLEQEGYNVQIATNGEEGVETAKAIHPILILMDLTMPKLNGFDACRMIKQDDSTKDIPVLVLTAMQLTSDVERAFEAGANDYVTKPYENDRLISKVKKLLNGGAESQ